MEEFRELLFQVRWEVRRNWLRAKQLLEEGLERNPEAAELSLELAQLFALRKNYKEAIRVCQRALLFRHDDQLCYVIGSCFLNLREYRIAVDYFERIREDFPEQLYNHAVALARCNRTEEAISIAKKVWDYHINSPIPSLLLAELYFLQKEYQPAIEICEEVERVYGASGEMYYMRGMCWTALHNFLKAYWDFHQAEQLKISNPEYYRNYGIVAEGIGKTEKAIELFKESIRLAPGSVGSYLELFRLYLAHDMLYEASELLSQARSSLPETFPLTLMYNRVIDRLHRADDY